MCAKYNMEIVNCTTPANFYHVIRRQLKRKFIKPLVVFTPKSLLRHPKCISSLDDLANDSFKVIIDDNIKYTNVSKLVFCSGKIYYELLNRRERDNINDIIIIRIEQLYPLDKKYIKELINKYRSEKIFLGSRRARKYGNL